ncbi:MAG TPA: hypothetical protein ENG62_02420 [Thermoplasmatales archaeon]|nr:hypothetical protein [Thermoplasmatales archaeon]
MSLLTSFIILLLILLFSTLGVLMGVLTGLLPGLHVNNIALILLSLSTSIAASLGFLSTYGIPQQFIFLLIAVFILSTSISHSFHDTIPTTFLGAPDEDTALSVLPAHSLLLEGNGFEAIALSAMGSYGAILFCFIILYPIRFIIGAPLCLYETLHSIMGFVLIAITILMIATEKGRVNIKDDNGVLPSILGILFATLLFFISGVFGLIILDFPVESPIGFSSPVLLPALTGLFGLPTLLTSLATKPSLPTQTLSTPSLDGEERNSLLSVITGSLAGILVAIIPGITSATGTIIAMNLRGESDKRQTIITLSAVNTACAFFVIVALFVILKGRSGAALAIQQLISVEEWSSVSIPLNLLYLLIALLFSGTLSYFSTLLFGRVFAKSFNKLPYQTLVGLTIVMITLLVFLFTGFNGLLIMLVATFIGLLPILWGVRRSHCMGVLLLPITLYFLT